METRDNVYKINTREIEQVAKILPLCIICEQVPSGGIRDGIVVAGSFICSRCEQEIVKTEIGAASYSYFQEKLKKLWRG